MKKFIVSICLVLLFINQLVFASSSNNNIYHFTGHALLPIVVSTDPLQKEVESVIAVDNTLISKINGLENSKVCRMFILASRTMAETYILLRPQKLICELTNKDIIEISLKDDLNNQIPVSAELVDESEIRAEREKFLSNLFQANVPQSVITIHQRTENNNRSYKVLRLPANTKIDGSFKLN